jgi:hypothetical protein
VQHLAGKNVLDCGTVPVKGDSSVTDACVVNAFNEKKPFRASYEIFSVDSEAAKVYVGTQESVYILHYDSDPCGGRGCGPEITTQACLMPDIVEEGGKSRLVC